MSGPTRGFRGTQIFSTLGVGTAYGPGNIVSGGPVDANAHWLSYLTMPLQTGKVRLVILVTSENTSDTPSIAVTHGPGVSFDTLTVDNLGTALDPGRAVCTAFLNPSTIHFLAFWGITSGTAQISIAEDNLPSGVVPFNPIDPPRIFAGNLPNTIAARCDVAGSTIWFRPNSNTDFVWRMYQGEISVPKNTTADLWFIATKLGYGASSKVRFNGLVNSLV